MRSKLNTAALEVAVAERVNAELPGLRAMFMQPLLDFIAKIAVDVVTDDEQELDLMEQVVAVARIHAATKHCPDYITRAVEQLDAHRSSKAGRAAGGAE
jgi:hypothetical protein